MTCGCAIWACRRNICYLGDLRTLAHAQIMSRDLERL